MEIHIRKGEKRDIEQVLVLIRELAEYENALEQVQISIRELEMDGFGSNPKYWFYVADLKSQIVGIAFCYLRYSTWKGKSVFLEDLVVQKEWRRKGVGKLLFNRVMHEAKQMQVRQVNWQVLDWNKPAIDFYKKYATEFKNEWINCTLKISTTVEGF